MCIFLSFSWLFFGQAKVVLIERNVCSVEHLIAIFLHQLVPSVSLVVPKESHLFFSVVKLLPLDRRDQGIGNTAKHSQVAEIWLYQTSLATFSGHFHMEFLEHSQRVAFVGHKVYSTRS